MLPYPNMDYIPFDILTAEELDQMVANIESLSDGTGVEAGAITPVKRAGGFYIGDIESSTMNSTGNKVITGVGFRPKLVRFTILPGNNSALTSIGFGSYDGTSQFYSSTANSARIAGTTGCIAFAQATSTTPIMLASGVSLDSDGFTINVSIAGAIPVAYEAYA